MKDMAIKKLDKELKELPMKNRKIKIMARPVHDALAEFCGQSAEFAQAIVQGGSFADCMEAVAKDVGNSISDLEAYRRAVQYYFPGAGVRMQMTINLCASVDADAPAAQSADAPVVLDLFELLGGA